jgi:foldase protein PrsA
MAFSAAIATAVCLGACGSGMPGNSVVQIGQATINTTALDHWLTVANDSGQVSNGTKAAPLPLPPNFAACVKAQQQAAGNTAQSHTAGEIATYKATCQQNYGTLVTEVLNYLIPRMWVEGEASSRGIHVTPKEVEAAYEKELKTSSPSLKTPKQLRDFLAASGQTVQDLKWLTMVNLLVNKIELQVQRQAGKVTPTDVTNYYNSHRSQYGTPETRDLHLVLTSSPATAQTVHNLLANGHSYASVASQYSVDSTSKANGGAMAGVSSSELTPQLSTKVFAAKPGVLSGPVKTPFGYYVFTVDKVTPAKVESLKDASASIKSLLSQQRVSAAESAFQSDFTKKWAPKTDCREGYQVPTYCSSSPKGSTTATGSTG